LPPEAVAEWPRALAYIRLSRGTSMVADAPDGYLHHTLALLKRHGYYVPPDAVYFEVETGTELSARGIFRRVIERALAGGVTAVGAATNERLFRNMDEKSYIKQQFVNNRIELLYVGMFEGDQRSPSAWQYEKSQDMMAEYHARNTGWNVALHLETASRNGRPMGKLPEAYEEGVRGPSILGRRGTVRSWKTVERLASVLQQGLRLYLEGEHTFADLARWSLSTELGGVTPKNHVMDDGWWYRQLSNPKFAGYQWPTDYVGYKPGKTTPRRTGPRPQDALVPCLLPPLWTLEEYRAVLALSATRHRSAKTRKTYRAYLTSGTLFAAECGHRLAVFHATKNGRFWVRCNSVRPGEQRHVKPFRADVVELELDALLARLTFKDPLLLKLIDEELADIARQETVDRRAFRPDPRIGSVRQALAGLEMAGVQAGRDALLGELRLLEQADAERRSSLSAPLSSFRAAVRMLGDWGAIWATGETKTKNKLLREAGLRVEIAHRPDDAPGAPGHIVKLAAANPAFALALAAALSSRDEALPTQPSGYASNALLRIELDEDSTALLGRFGGRLDGNSALTSAPIVAVPQRRKPTVVPPRPSPEWLTCPETAARVGRSPTAVLRWIRGGLVPAVRVPRGRKGQWFIHRDEVERLRTNCGPMRPRPSDELLEWLRHELNSAPVSQNEVRNRSGVSWSTVDRIRAGGSTPYIATVISLARVLLALRRPHSAGASVLLELDALERSGVLRESAQRAAIIAGTEVLPGPHPKSVGARLRAPEPGLRCGQLGGDVDAPRRKAA
jgi:hypothetical protein